MLCQLFRNGINVHLKVSMENLLHILRYISHVRFIMLDDKSFLLDKDLTKWERAKKLSSYAVLHDFFSH